MLNTIFHTFCLLLFLPLALTVSVRPVFSAVPFYAPAREYAPDNACVCPPELVPAYLRTTQPSRLAYNAYASSGSYTSSSITYDSNSNRLTYGGTSYTIDSASNRMTAAGGSSITYTSAGNISGIGSDTFAYNKANQMATATVSGTASAYVYDAFGQRLKSTVGAGTPVIQQYGMGGMLLSETQGAAETNYVYLNGLPIAAINTASPALSYIHTNHLGTPQKATNSSQSVVWSGAYQPFGAVTPTTSITQNLRFPGQYADPTNLYYNMFRNYNPALGRYLESDPIGLMGGINSYIYVENNPYKWVDMDGLAAECPPGKSGCQQILGPSAVGGGGIAPGRSASGQASTPSPAVGAQTKGGAATSNPTGNAQAAGVTGANAQKGTNVSTSTCASGNCATGSSSPDFVVSPGGVAFPVPRGATGPTPADKGVGGQYQGGSGGNGLNPRTTGFRYMDPTTTGKNPYPSGRGTYNNESGQTVDPLTGRTTDPSNPMSHIPGGK